MERGIYRLLDANLNRAREGLRVAEEYVRFVRDDAVLSERLKELRHGVRRLDELLAASLPAGQTWAHFRDTPGDVGTALAGAGEAVRADAAGVAAASRKRVEEALRVIEEYAKLISPDAAQLAEKLRYSAYGLEGAWQTAGGNLRQRLQSARLYVLITESLARTDALTVCREAVAGGADIIQMREKELEDGEFLNRARQMAEACRAGGTLFLVNDRVQIAALGAADGLHTGQGDLPVNLVRRLAGPEAIIGKSTSCPERAEAAWRDGADYIGVGPVYPTKTKEHRAAVGLEYVRWASAHARLPYFCIGSINRRTLPEVLAAGARAVAVCTAIIAAPDIAAETAWFKARLAETAAGREPLTPKKED